MTVFPRNSVANSFMPAPPRIPRCLFFLSGTPSPGNRSETVRIVIERISVTHDVTFLYAKERFAEHLPEADSLDHIVIERSCFLGLVTAAGEADSRETNGFLVGTGGTRLVRQRPRGVTVLRAAYPLQTEDRKPNWVSHGNEKAFERARGAIEHADVGYAVLGGFHSHTGDDGAASLSRTDLDYVADELRRISRDRPERRRRWPAVVMSPRRLTRRRLAGPGAAPEPVTQELLDLRGVPDHVDLQGVVPRVHDDRPDLEDPLAEGLMEVHSLELGVRDHLGVLVQDPVLANDLVVRDDVPRRLPLQLGREKGEEREEDEETREDRAQLDARDRGIREGRREPARDAEAEDRREDEGQHQRAPISQGDQPRRSRHEEGLLPSVVRRHLGNHL